MKLSKTRSRTNLANSELTGARASPRERDLRRLTLVSTDLSNTHFDPDIVHEPMWLSGRNCVAYVGRIITLEKPFAPCPAALVVQSTDQAAHSQGSTILLPALVRRIAVGETCRPTTVCSHLNKHYAPDNCRLFPRRSMMQWRFGLAILSFIIATPIISAQEAKPFANLELKGKDRFITNMAFSPDGKIFAALHCWSVGPCSVTLWDTANGKELRKNDCPIGALATAPPSRILPKWQMAGRRWRRRDPSSRLSDGQTSPSAIGC